MNYDRARRIKALLAIQLDACHATVDEGTSVLGSLMLDMLVAARAFNDDQVAAEMRRFAQRLVELADAPVSEVKTRAVHLADQQFGPVQ